MAKRITEFTSATSLAETDVLPIVDVSDTTQATSGTTKKSALSLIADYLKARVETLTNKTIDGDTNTISNLAHGAEVDNPASGVHGVTGSVVGTTDTQTLTNKTLTAPALSSPTISGAWDGWISAGETWTYASADDPTFTFTVNADVTTKYSAGMKIKLTQGTVKYFIITAVSTYSGGNTTITVYGGTDYDLANSAISANAYSMMKSPQGFPLDPDKWSVEFSTTTRGTTNPASQNVWCNPGSFSLSIPIGSWDVFYKVVAVAVGGASVRTSLSTANNSQSDSEFTTRFSGVPSAIAPMYVGKAVTLTSKTTYYLVAMSPDPNISQIRLHSDDGATVIRATCAYL